jgi:hypothetical protein
LLTTNLNKKKEIYICQSFNKVRSYDHFAKLWQTFGKTPPISKSKANLLTDIKNDLSALLLVEETSRLTLDGAKLMVSAAESEAIRVDEGPVAISIVDSGANLVLFHKMDDVQNASIDISIGKAKTSVNFKRSTYTMENLGRYTDRRT